MLRRIVAAFVLIGAAVLTPAAASAETYGAALSPQPLIVEHWEHPAVTVGSRSDMPIHVALAITGDGYALAETAFDLAPKETRDVPLSAVGKGDAEVTATITTDAVGMDKAVLVIGSHVRHAGPLDGFPWLLALLVALTGALVGLRAVWGKRWR